MQQSFGLAAPESGNNVKLLKCERVNWYCLIPEPLVVIYKTSSWTRVLLERDQSSVFSHQTLCRQSKDQ